MKIIALLPMKANSERVKGKNFRDFGVWPERFWPISKRCISHFNIGQVELDFPC